MPIIDVHAHMTPERFKEAIRREGNWYGLGPEAGEIHHGGFANSVEQRLADMDEMGVDMHLLTPCVGFYQYDNDLDTTRTVARECNDEISETIDAHPDRFSGLGILPMQDIPSAIAELERIMSERNLKGAMIGDHVNGRTYDEPAFEPFFSAVEEMGAVLFFHQGGPTCVASRISRYKLTNAVGNPADRTLTFGTLVFGGVMDRHPDLQPILAHGGGYTTFGIARMDKVSGALDTEEGADRITPAFGRGEGEYDLQRAPSTYLRQFYYDCCTYNERALRYIIDTVGVDRVMLGTDYPAPMFLQDAVNWINGMESLTADEKEAVLSGNVSKMLGL
jgi:aminocarboxymuconate-semialdehyde decarboxylase